MKWLLTILFITSSISLTNAYLYNTQGYGSGCYNQDCNSTTLDLSDNKTSPPSSSSGGGGGGGSINPRGSAPKVDQLIPSELLDVTFRVLEYVVSSSDELVTITELQSFGRNPANVSLKYVVRDEFNQTLFSELENIIVFSEEAVTKKFEGLNLSRGEYNVELEVEFAGFTERFEAKFRVAPIAFSPKVNNFILWSIVPFFLLIILIILIRKKTNSRP